MFQVFENKNSACAVLTSVMMLSSMNIDYNNEAFLHTADFCSNNDISGYYCEAGFEKQNYYNNFVFSAFDGNRYDGISADNYVLSSKNGTIDIIRAFGDLEAGWDGYNGQVIDKMVINFAMELIARLPEQIEAFPLSSGNIQLQCENNNQDYFELEVLPNGNIALFVEWNNGEVLEKSICYNNLAEKEELINLITRFQG